MTFSVNLRLIFDLVELISRIFLNFVFGSQFENHKIFFNGIIEKNSVKSND